jgi:hypothetical protein
LKVVLALSTISDLTVHNSSLGSGAHDILFALITHVTVAHTSITRILSDLKAVFAKSEVATPLDRAMRTNGTHFRRYTMVGDKAAGRTI